MKEKDKAFPQPSHCTMRESEPRQGRAVPPILPGAPVPGTPDKIGTPTRRQAGRLPAIPDPVRSGMSRPSCLRETKGAGR
ncbi:hypothetical protein Amme_176_001 [Acidomonas methanolica NBRC 104435]|uniref:Uncharacterized protein n=1 Tax=Acidomonas methanolica NBRC 104435 TaxID=1231351 RepID=A0A023DA28_ACIMT|nr:hypothetical protein Amme_176_001 [Acidomonas methanolica NBRC 104435]